ncbi:beta-ketoacyl-ACP synthase III [Nitrincola alkalisediminis]|uniref:beta-ketoacyl-ACP synthase III n=1 Tax=Nitrincola alkalisediminis TaxID=1366656 RepID=UPI003CCD3101
MPCLNTVISGVGLYTPIDTINNDELVESFNRFVADYNEQNSADIAQGELTELQPSSTAFIDKASGILSRYVIDKQGILDPKRMKPYVAPRANDSLSLQAEMAVKAAQLALDEAGLSGADLDCVIVACSNLQRAYPAVAIEVQQALGAGGFAFDMNVACSSATFALQLADNTLQAGSASRVLVVNPEICSAHLNYRDRDSHFIFGDACTAMIVEPEDAAHSPRQFRILGTRLKTAFSNNIRNNFGFLTKCEDRSLDAPDTYFVQQGRKVFKDVVPMVADLILDHLNSLKLPPSDLRRLWLHQANINMNSLIARKVLGRDPTQDEAPTILHEFGNTSSAASIIAFERYRDGLESGDLCLLSSFGAGYSVGSVVLRKV